MQRFFEIFLPQRHFLGGFFFLFCYFILMTDAISPNKAAWLKESAKVPPSDVRRISRVLDKFFKESSGAEHWPLGLRKTLCDLFERANLRIDPDLWDVLQKPTTFRIEINIRNRMQGLLESLRDSIERGDVRPSPLARPTTSTGCGRWPLLATPDDLIEGVDMMPRLNPDALHWLIATLRPACGNSRIHFDGHFIRVCVASQADALRHRIVQESKAMRDAGRADLMPDDVIVVQPFAPDNLSCR